MAINVYMMIFIQWKTVADMRHGGQLGVISISEADLPLAWPREAEGDPAVRLMLSLSCPDDF